MDVGKKKSSALGWRMWFFIILVGFAGQLAWSIENMYLNTYITYINFSSPLEQQFDYSTFIAWTTALSAIVATLTTIIIGAVTDRVGHKRWFISIGYILWGLSTAAFGLFNVNSTSKLIPIAIASSMAAIWVIILDCVMTFFGSTANDASFNSYITKNIKEEHRGKVEGVLEILPLVAMLVIFVALNGLTTDSSKGANDARWDLFFYVIGAVVLLIGIFSFFMIPKEEEKKSDTKISYLLIEGFKPSVIKRNPKLYLILLIYFVYATASQVFFPYLMIYLQKTCNISNVGALSSFAIVMAVALLIGSVLSVLLGVLSDKYGKDRMILPSFAIFALGVLLMFFIPMIDSDLSRTIYAAIAGVVMIFGYVGVPTVVNALVRQYTPKGNEGTYMGVRMLFVVALPMCIGPFIGNGINQVLGSTYTDETFGTIALVPSEYGYLVGLGVLLFALIPIIFYLRKEKSDAGQQQSE